MVYEQVLRGDASVIDIWREPQANTTVLGARVGKHVGVLVALDAHVGWDPVDGGVVLGGGAAVNSAHCADELFVSVDGCVVFYC